MSTFSQLNCTLNSTEYWLGLQWQPWSSSSLTYKKVTKATGEKYQPFESTQAKTDWQTFIFSKTVELLEATKMPWWWFELLLQRLTFPGCSLMPGSQDLFNSHIFWLCKLCKAAENSVWALPGHGVEVKPRNWTLAGKDGITRVPCSQ